MISGRYSRLKKVILGILSVIIITTAIMLVDSLRSTKSLENRAASPLAGQCLLAERFCEWDTSSKSEGIIFHYQIVDVSTSESLIAAEGDTEENFVSFNPLSNRSYKCVIKATNNCNVSSKNFESSLTTCKAGEDQAKNDPSPTPRIVSPPIHTATATSPTQTLDPNNKTIKMIQA